MKRLAAFAASAAVMFAPNPALAQSSSTCQAYNPQLCSVSAESDQTASTGTLPFTGLDIGTLALAGSGLAAAGMLLRVKTHRPK
jgi:hypothetical protein